MGMPGVTKTSQLSTVASAVLAGEPEVFADLAPVGDPLSFSISACFLYLVTRIDAAGLR
jgi:hypothetical protein